MAICQGHYSIWNKIFKRTQILYMFSHCKIEKKIMFVAWEYKLYDILQPLSVKQKSMYQMKDTVTTVEKYIKSYGKILRLELVCHLG
jgi:hypothetical protein